MPAAPASASVQVLRNGRDPRLHRRHQSADLRLAAGRHRSRNRSVSTFSWHHYAKRVRDLLNVSERPLSPLRATPQRSPTKPKTDKPNTSSSNNMLPPRLPAKKSRAVTARQTAAKTPAETNTVAARPKESAAPAAAKSAAPPRSPKVTEKAQTPPGPSEDVPPIHPVIAQARDLGNFKISGCPRKGKGTHTHIWVNFPCNSSPAAASIIPPRQLSQDQLFALARAGTRPVGHRGGRPRPHGAIGGFRGANFGPPYTSFNSSFNTALTHSAGRSCGDTPDTASPPRNSPFKGYQNTHSRVSAKRLGDIPVWRSATPHPYDSWRNRCPPPFELRSGVASWRTAR